MRLIYNKIAASLLILAASSTVAYAQVYKDEGVAPVVPCNLPCMLKDGFYIGAQVGYDSYRVRENITAPFVSVNPQISVTGWVGGLFLGYGQYINDALYLGGEVMGDYSDANSNVTTTTPFVTATSQIRVRGSWGVAVLPGVRLSDSTLAYVRLGYNWANIRAHNAATILGVGAVTINKTNSSSGFNFGVGIETLVYEDWSVRAEYTYTNYNSFTSAIGTKYNPSDNQFMLSAIYHINCLF